MEQDKRHIPQSSTKPHNAQTKPAKTQDVDKLRENPHNDEKTISQNRNNAKPANDVDAGSTFARKDEERNQVTNDEEQNQVINPGTTRIENNANQPEPEIPANPDSPDSPSQDPYKEIGDDADENKRKIPNM